MVEQKSWEEFRNSGMLWWINMILHTFGWALVIECLEEENIITNCYPARVKFRGFGEQNNTDGYIKVSKYLDENIKDIREEAEK